MREIEIIFILMGGVGLFLFAMTYIEAAVHELAGRSFKLLLKSVVRDRVTAVAGSALLTILLQGSSVLNLLLLAFVGSGLITLSDAIPLLLGANLGSTLDAWVVAVLGFKMNIELIAYPAVFVAALLYLFPSGKMKSLSRLFLGFGLFFIGIMLMKEGAMRYMLDAGSGFFSGWAQWEASLAGIVLTAVIQSSLATMTLSLSALHAGAIDLHTAAALVIGAEVGTTLKLFMGTFDGLPVKKRLALANLVINVITFLLAYVLLDEILLLITSRFGIADPLISLVSFQTAINLISVMLILPFSERFARFMDQCFTDTSHRSLLYIGRGESEEAETSSAMFLREAEAFLRLITVFCGALLKLKPGDAVLPVEETERNNRFLTLSADAQYGYLKNLQGELQLYASMQMMKKSVDKEFPSIEAGISAARSAMHAAKCLMDVGENIHALAESSREEKYTLFTSVQRDSGRLFLQLKEIPAQEEVVRPGFVKEIYLHVMAAYDRELKNLYYLAGNGSIGAKDFTLMMNFNREVFTAHKSLVMAYADFCLSPEDAAVIAEIPSYRS